MIGEASGRFTWSVTTIGTTTEITIGTIIPAESTASTKRASTDGGGGSKAPEGREPGCEGHEPPTFEKIVRNARDEIAP
jgi:hypothetical protein